MAAAIVQNRFVIAAPDGCLDLSVREHGEVRGVRFRVRFAPTEEHQQVWALNPTRRKIATENSGLTSSVVMCDDFA
jgi:hypothetical protein